MIEDEALLRAGLSCIEITLRTRAADRAVRRLSESQAAAAVETAHTARSAAEAR